MKILIGRQATGFGRKASTPSQVLRLANGEIDLDGIDSGDGGNRATAGLNERADLQECLAGDALDGCGEALNSRLILAVSTAASYVRICAFAVSMVAMAARLFWTALSRSCWLAACSRARGVYRLTSNWVRP